MSNWKDTQDRIRRRNREDAILRILLFLGALIAAITVAYISYVITWGAVLKALSSCACE